MSGKNLKKLLFDWKKKHTYLYFTSTVLLFIVIFFAGFYIYIAYLLPIPDIFDNESHPTTKIFDRNGKLLYEMIQPDFGNRTLISIEDIPQDFINATLSAEDINFYNHPGVDILAVGRAIFFNVKEQRIVSGASTITQQLVRNIIGKTEPRDIWDKILESIYAVRLTNIYSKDEVLELYLNRVYYGNMSYGAQSAAQDYFGKNIYDLDLAQGSFLAGLPQSPSRYNPYVSFDQAKTRQEYVLARMQENGFISKREAEAALAQPVYLRANKHLMHAPHFVHYIINELERDCGEEALRTQGLQITTTLDLDLQMQAERIIERNIKKLEKNNVNNGALLAVDVKSGQILAWAGSANYFDSEIDGAVDIVTSPRQPGSSIKPFTYLLAFEDGYTPATVIFDIPTQFSTETGPYAPKNYDLDYHGPVRVRTALASSFNIPAVKTLEYVGVENLIQFFRKAGVDTLNGPASHYGLALTLGGGEVRLFDMARVYHVLANLGDRMDFSSILKIEGQNGTVIYNWRLPDPTYILGKYGRQHAYQIIDILKDPYARIAGFGDGSVLETPFKSAVKTGTTRNFRDNWTIGFTPNLLTAVWVGNADASPMENISGIDGAAPIWADFMNIALESFPEVQFEMPGEITEIEICELSGKLPTDLCPDKIYEIFVKGSEPTLKDDYYKKYFINSLNGKIIPDECKDSYPSSQIEQKVLVTYPPELQKWAVQKGLAVPQYERCALSNGNPDGYTNGYPEENTESVFIDNPANNDEYLYQSILPKDAQKIPFRVRVPEGTIEVKFYVDGTEAGTSYNEPYTFLWPPDFGGHKLTAAALLYDGASITSREVKFYVK